MKKIIILFIVLIMSAGIGYLVANIVQTQQEQIPTPPINNSNARIAPITFSENITTQEQQFDFYIHPNETQNFNIGVEFWIPDEIADKHLGYFSDKYYDKAWRVGKDVPYFNVTLEHHLLDGTVRYLPLQGVKSFIHDDLLVEKFMTPPATFSVFCQTTAGRSDSYGKQYTANKCGMTKLYLNEVPDYRNGFFRLKIKSVGKLKLDDFILVKAMVSYPTNHK